MRTGLGLLTTAAVVAASALVAPIGLAAPSSALPGSTSVGVGAAATESTPALDSATPDLVPVEPEVESYPLSPLPAASTKTKAGREVSQVDPAVLAAVSAPEPADAFVVTGATWRGQAPEGLSIEVRTRTDDVWSPWTEMTYDDEHGPSADSSEAAEARPGTDPFVAGDVDDVQLRAASADGSMPAGLTLDIIDPGLSVPDSTKTTANSRGDASTPTVAAKAATVTAGVQVPAVTPRPTIHTRAEWGAAESLRDCCVEFGEVHAAFVHHTVNANNYRAAEVPAILRGIYAYHTQSRGWRDIGYNYLIDRFGRIWEGRYGGITMPVIGAHTLNYNENAFAASAIGNFETTQPSAAMLDAYARLFAWKLSLHGIEPTTRQIVAGTKFNAINGHRDAASTACPGINLYRKIGVIIAKAAEYQRSFSGRDIQHTFVGNRRPDVLAVSRINGRVNAGTGTAPPRFGAPTVVRSDFAVMDHVVVAGDLTGDGHLDLLVRNKESGVTRVFRGSGTGAFTATRIATSRWADTDLFAVPGDVTGDAKIDVVARVATTGELMLYPGKGQGLFGAARLVASRFAAANALAPAGDFDRDGNRDLLTRGASGAVRVLFGDGTGLFARNVVLARDWRGISAFTGGVDLTGDERPDLVARSRATKTTRIYANIAGTRLSPGIGGTTQVRGPISLSDDVDGDGVPEIASNAAGSLVLVSANRRNWFTPAVAQGTTMLGADRVMVVGDWNRDGYVDTMGYEKATKKIWFYPGGAAGVAAKKRAGGWTDLAGFKNITAVGDFNGDRWPDLMARGRDAAIWLFPGRGDAGFAGRIKVRSSLPAGAVMFGVGRWTRDGAPDVGVRNAAGHLWIYPGNGPGGLDDPISLGSRFARYDSMFLVGDLTRDRQPDLLGRDAAGDLWVLPKQAPSANKPAGSIGKRMYAGSGWQSYRLN